MAKVSEPDRVENEAGSDSAQTGTGGGPVVARPVDGPTEVVHDDLGALGREQERVLTSNPPAGASDDRHPPFERTHVPLLLGVLGQFALSTTPVARSISP